MATEPKKNLSSPSVSPSYTPGAVRSVKPKATIGEYVERLKKNYKAPPIKKKAPVVPVKTGKNPVPGAVGEEYQQMMQQYKGNLAKQRESAMQLYNSNRDALESNRNTSRNAITGQRGSDLGGISDDYAARGISRSSGVYQQAGTDYDSALAQRLKDVEESYSKQNEQETKTRDSTINEADNEYATQTAEATAAAAARKAAALDTTKKAATAPKPKAPTKPIPKAAPKASPLKAGKPKLMNGG